MRPANRDKTHRKFYKNPSRKFTHKIPQIVFLFTHKIHHFQSSRNLLQSRSKTIQPISHIQTPQSQHNRPKSSYRFKPINKRRNTRKRFLIPNSTTSNRKPQYHNRRRSFSHARRPFYQINTVNPKSKV